MKRRYPDAASALEYVLADGISIRAGGFGPCGVPERLIDAIQKSGIRDPTIAGNNAGAQGVIAEDVAAKTTAHYLT